MLPRLTPAAARGRRVTWLLIGICVIHLFDLGFTLLAREQGILVEANPVAAHMIAVGPGAVTSYKLVLLGTALLILWTYRRHRVAEAVCWTVAFCCVGVCLLWYKLYLDAQPLWVEVNQVSAILPSRITVLNQLAYLPR